MITQEQLNEYTTLSAAAKHLGYKSRNSLEQFIKQGKLTFLTLGNGTRICHWNDIIKLKDE